MSKLNILDRIRFPQHGKKLLVIRDGELRTGGVIWKGELVQVFPKLNEIEKLKLLIEAANSLRVPPHKVQDRLGDGKVVLYRGHERG